MIGVLGFVYGVALLTSYDVQFHAYERLWLSSSISPKDPVDFFFWPVFQIRILYVNDTCILNSQCSIRSLPSLYAQPSGLLMFFVRG